MLVDLRLVEGPELGLVLGDHGHLDLGGLEVGGEDGGEAVDRHLGQQGLETRPAALVKAVVAASPSTAVQCRVTWMVSSWL